MERLAADGTVVVTLERAAVPRRSSAKALLTARLPKRPKKAARGPQRISGLAYRPLVEVSTCDACGHAVTRSEQVTTWAFAKQ